MKNVSFFRRHSRMLAMFIFFSAVATRVVADLQKDSSPISKMECKSDGDKIVCQVVLEKGSAFDWRLEHCLEDDGVCLEATVTQTPKEARYATEENAKTRTLADAFPTRTAMHRGNEENSQWHPNQQHSPLTVGTRTYEPPFDQYGSEVARELEYISRQISPDADDLDLAESYMELAMAHRGETSDQRSLNPLRSFDISKIDVEAAINAGQEALRIYERKLLEVHLDIDRDTVTMAIGTITSLLGDTSLLFPEERRRRRVLEYFRQSEDAFQQLLQHAATRLDAATYGDVELRWADATSRVGILLIEQAQTIPMEGDATSSELDHVDEVLDVVEEGRTKLKGAIEVYRIAANRNEVDPQQKTGYQSMLANSLHSVGTASVLLAQNEEAAKEWEEAIQVYEQLSSHGDYQEENLSLTAELLYSLSTVYLQMGMYDETNERYDRAMKLFSQLGTPSAITDSVTETGMESDDLLEGQEQMLREYHESLYRGQEIHMHDDFDNEGEQDDLYEAQLHSTIGALKMSGDDKEGALTHLYKALDLYSDTLGDEDRLVANLKINIAVLYITLEDYDESNKIHREAVETYRVTVGEGKNPLVDEELLAALKRSMSGSNDRKEEEDTTKDRTSHSRDSVHERLIDVDEFKRGLMNMTKTVADEL